MSIRKLSDTEFELTEEYEESSLNVDVEITKHGIVLGSYVTNVIEWEDIAKARDVLSLVSFTDEEFEKWALENGYVKQSNYDNLKEAATSALKFISNYKIPQSRADAAVQIFLQVAPIINELQTALSIKEGD